MAHKENNKTGFLIVACKAQELMDIEFGALGICDYCDRFSLEGYLCCVLGHRYYCPHCYKRWVNTAARYPEDTPYETQIFNEWKTRFQNAKLWEEK